MFKKHSPKHLPARHMLERMLWHMPKHVLTRLVHGHVLGHVFGLNKITKLFNTKKLTKKYIFVVEICSSLL